MGMQKVKKYTLDETIFTDNTVRFFKGKIQFFNKLFEWTKFLGYFIIIGETENLRNESPLVFVNLELMSY